MSRVGFQPTQQVAEIGSRQSNRCIGCAVVKAQLAGCRIVYGAARKNDVTDIARSLICFVGAENPLIAAPDDSTGRLKIQQGEPQSVEATRRRIANAVIDYQPSLGSLDGRR